MTRSIRVKLRHWHRKLGAAVALGAVFIVISGMVINHASQLKLDQPGVNWHWVLDHYGIDVAAPETGWLVEGQWISHSGSRAFWNDQPLFRSPPLIGALSTGGLVLTASSEQLSLLSPDGELIEQLGRDALPAAILQLQSIDDRVLLKTSAGWFQSNLDFLSWDRINAPNAKPLSTQAIPTDLAAQIHRQARALELSWERVLLDLHSGRFFGAWGPWVVDLIALGIALLALSGFWLWFRAQSRHH